MTNGWRVMRPPDEKERGQHSSPEFQCLAILPVDDEIVESDRLVRHIVGASPDRTPGACHESVDRCRVAAVQNGALGAQEFLVRGQISGAVLDVVEVLQSAEAVE